VYFNKECFGDSHRRLGYHDGEVPRGQVAQEFLILVMTESSDFRTSMWYCTAGRAMRICTKRGPAAQKPNLTDFEIQTGSKILGQAPIAKRRTT